MADNAPNLDFGTKRLDPNDLVPLIQLYTIPYLRWDREGYETFESRRARLLNTLSTLHEQMRGNSDTVQTPLRFLLLGGQTVILEDIAAVHPELTDTLVDYNDKGRLSIGPWYVAVNEALVSDEALTRNLMAARDDARRYRVKLMPIAYFPESFGHVSQLPQILQGFGIDAALISHGLPVIHLPFNWEAPDGSQILVVNDEPRTGWPPPINDVEEVAASLESQRAVRPDGPFLWLYEIVDPDANISEMVKSLSDKVEVPVQYSNLLQYSMALRHELPDDMRPMLGGELWIQSLKERAYLFPGTLSSRIYLKQANARLQAYLLHVVEPLLAVTLTHGQPSYPDNLRNLLDHSWRLLLKNQAANALGGTSIDAVHRENELRFQKVSDNATALVREVLEIFTGTPYQNGRAVDAQKSSIVVWNGHNWPLQQYIEVRLVVPDGKYPVKVTAADGSEMLFGWKADVQGSDGVLSLVAKPPALGYTTYTVEFGDAAPSESHQITTTGGTAISNGADTVQLEDGVLVWRSGDREIRNLLEFYDGGDAGDTFNYSPPETDLIERADLISDTKVELSPLYQRLLIRHRMRIAVGLNADRTRSRGLRLIELLTTITLYTGMPGVYFQTEFENTARDHRLRAHLRTGMKSDFVHADSAYALMKRLAVTEGPAFPEAGQEHIEGVINTQAVQRVVAVMGENHSLNLLVRGLPEYEAIEEDDQLTFALTLVRAVGWLSRNDLRTRTAAVAPVVEVPEAQSLREFTAEYALIYTGAGDSAAVLRAGREFNAPLIAQQYIASPDRLERSYLSVLSNRGTGAHSDGNGVIVTAFKPPVKGKGWIIRMFNPNNEAVEVHLTPHQRPSAAFVMLMSEKPKRALEMDSNGSANVIVGPHEVMTVRFTFDG